MIFLLYAVPLNIILIHDTLCSVPMKHLKYFALIRLIGIVFQYQQIRHTDSEWLLTKKYCYVLDMILFIFISSSISS